MNWDDLRFALAVARHGSFGGAARELAVTRPTVGRRIAALEESLDARLFDRTPEGMVPTSAGEETLRRAEQMEIDAHALDAGVRGRSALLNGDLTVATLDILLAAFPELFTSFVDRYPAIRLTVSTTLEEVSLSRREADIALRLSNDPPDYLVGRRVGKVAFAPHACESLTGRYGRDATAPEYPWLHWDRRLNPRWLDSWFSKNAPKARVVMRLCDAGAFRAAMDGGVGAHFWPCFDSNRNAKLKRVGPIVKAFERDLWLLTLPELKSARRVKAFVLHAAEFLSTRQAMLAGEALVDDGQ